MSTAVTEKLIELRGDRTRESVAKQVGISVSALQMYETGHRTPRDHIKMRLAAYYEVTVEELFFTPMVHKSCTNETA